MTRDEIIKALDWHAPSVEHGPQNLLRRIEKLVAMAEAAEREACAKELEAITDRIPDEQREGFVYMTAIECVAVIRARGEKK